MSGQGRVYTPKISPVHLKFLWGIFSSSYEAEHQQATASWNYVAELEAEINLLAVDDKKLNTAAVTRVVTR